MMISSDGRRGVGKIATATLRRLRLGQCRFRYIFCDPRVCISSRQGRNINAMIRRDYRLRACVSLAWLIMIVLLSGVQSASAQPDQPSDTTSRVDTTSQGSRVGSLERDSTMADSTAVSPAAADTARLRAYEGTLGTTAGDVEDAGYRFIRNRDLVLLRYYTMFDILAPFLPAYPVSHGSPGLVRAFSYAGAAPGSIGVLFNGRPLPGDVGGGYDLELYPAEFLERAEILRGARATLFGGGESLIALNFVQPHYDVEGSYVRIAYSQGLYNLTSADLTYARNFGRTSNLTVGFRRLPSDGEFPNQSVSNTSLRATLTSNPIEGLAVSLTEIYSSATRGLSGGLIPGSSRQRAEIPTVVTPDLREEQLRHDVTLAARWAPVDAADTLSDSSRIRSSTAAIDAALYYSYARRTLLGIPDTIPHGGNRRREIIGGRGATTLPLGPFRAEINVVGEFAAGGFADSVGGDAAVRGEVGGLGEIALGPVLLRGGGKLSAGDAATARTTLVGEGILGISQTFSTRATLRLFNGGNDPSPLDSLRGFSSIRTRLLAEGAIDWRSGNLQAGIDAFYRQSEDAAVATYGAGGHLRFPLLWLILDARLLAQVDPDGDERFPALRGTGDVWWEGKLFRDNLDLRVGTSLIYQSGLRGAEYDPWLNEPVYPSDLSRPLSNQLPIWSAYAQARIGSAFIRATFDNILDVEQWTLYRYPVGGRGLHLQVTWTLID